MVVPEDVPAVTDHTARVGHLEHARHDQVTSWRVHPVVDALQALRGVPCTVAVTTVAALGDLRRVEHPRPRRPCFGVSPSADSSGERRRQGSRTNAGKTHARRACVAGAWASRSPAQGSRHVPLRREPRPPPRQALRWRVHGRRCNRVRRVRARGKHANQVVVARARELAGVLRTLAPHVPVAPAVTQTARPWPHNAAGLPR
jgi:transposase